MIDLKLLLQEEKNLGKNPLTSYKASNFESLDKSIAALKEDKAMPKKVTVGFCSMEDSI